MCIYCMIFFWLLLVCTHFKRKITAQSYIICDLLNKIFEIEFIKLINLSL